MIRRIWLIPIIFVSFASDSFGETKELSVAFGNTLAPWIIPASDQGILPAFLRASLSNDYQLSYKYLPYARRIPAWRTGKFDVVSDIFPALMKQEKLTGFYSGPIYEYENILVSLEEKKLRLLHIDDLSNLSLMAWQGASKNLGPEYARMARQNPYYSEHPNQELQLKMLFARRIDVILLDRRIFNYFRAKLAGSGSIIDTSQPVRVATIFPEGTKAGFLFKKAEVRDQFLRGFEKLTEENIAEIYNSQ